jgi:hypothetical protein
VFSFERKKDTLWDVLKRAVLESPLLDRKNSKQESNIKTTFFKATFVYHMHFQLEDICCVACMMEEKSSNKLKECLKECRRKRRETSLT